MARMLNVVCIEFLCLQSGFSNIDGLVRDCSANALELLQACTEPSICTESLQFCSSSRDLCGT